MSMTGDFGLHLIAKLKPCVLHTDFNTSPVPGSFTEALVAAVNYVRAEDRVVAQILVRDHLLRGLGAIQGVAEAVLESLQEDGEEFVVDVVQVTTSEILKKITISLK